jgi:aryl-alcohol dehydrogenase-like predicted oxidoreductase
LRVGQLAAVNLRLPGGGRIDARFDDQLAAMVAARDEGLIAGVGLSNVSLEQLQHAAAGTDIVCRAQVALEWLLQLAPNVLLIPGTGSVAHLRENLAAERVTLDDEALRNLDSVGAWDRQQQ